jgi:hypothetical protein
LCNKRKKAEDALRALFDRLACLTGSLAKYVNWDAAAALKSKDYSMSVQGGDLNNLQYKNASQALKIGRAARSERRRSVLRSVYYNTNTVRLVPRPIPPTRSTVQSTQLLVDAAGSQSTIDRTVQFRSTQPTKATSQPIVDCCGHCHQHDLDCVTTSYTSAVDRLGSVATPELTAGWYRTSTSKCVIEHNYQGVS